MGADSPSAKPGPRFSLRLKLTLDMMAVALVLQALLGTIVLYYQYAAIEGFFNARLSSRTDALVTQLRQANFRVTDEDLGRMAHQSPRLVLFETTAAVLYTPAGEVVASTVRPAPPLDGTFPTPAAPSGAAVARRAVRGVFAGAHEAVRSRIAVRRLSADGGREFLLVFLADDWNFDAMAAVMLRVFLVASAVSIVAWGVAAWLIAGLAMAPLKHLRQVAGSFSPESLEQDLNLAITSTEVAALEQDLRESRVKLRSALHAQDRFISNVSHELNTPIAILLTEAQTLRHQDLPPDAKAFALSVTEEMQRLGRMVGSFLTLTKVRGGHGLAVADSCDMNDVVMDTIETSGGMAARYRVTLVPRLAEGDPPVIVSGDGDLLRLMLENLVRNAIRFSPENRQVTIQVVRAGPQCEVRVQDAGRGVADALLATIFDRFAETPKEPPRGRGHGLGLSVAQGIAELHGGEITVRNLPGEGCEFTVRLPLAQSVPASVGPSPVAPSAV